MSAQRPGLAALAGRLGIAPAYWDIAGNQTLTSDTTREALVAGMGHDASDEARCSAVLDALDAAERDALVEPVLVWREFEGRAPLVPIRAEPPCEWEIELRLESGEEVRATGAFGADAARPLALALPRRPDPGYHDLLVRVAAGGVVREGRQRLVMAPRSAHAWSGERVFGLWSNLYAVRGARGWGVGDATDLAAQLACCARAGGAFVGVNPLHAVANRGDAITPYSPTSRLFRNALYLDVEAVTEWRDCEAARRRAAEPAFAAELARLRGAATIDHGAVLDAKRAVLALLFERFCAARRERPANPRAAAFAAFVAREGRALRDFATWEALAEHFAERPEAPATHWRAWPAAYHHPEAPAVAAFRDAHAEAVERGMWVQFELAEQLRRAQAYGRAAGLAIGIYQDLAVGSAADSADTWMAPSRFADGVSVGAPPDAYAPEGQDWGFPPLDPHRSRADGHRFFAAMLRANFAGAGALRIDHAMGLLRLFWIPVGRKGSEGTYVRYPGDELFGVLALESQRARALVIAEDLGTVPDGFRPMLRDWGMLSSAVVVFERDDGVPRPAARVAEHALATVETHDLPPIAGYFDGADLELRRAAGALDDAGLAAARAEREGERRAWIARLREEALLAASEPDTETLTVALHAFLARTPALLAGVALDDLAGERVPVNLPGIPVARHRSWSRRMQQPLDAIFASPLARAILAALAERARAGACSAAESAALDCAS